jgi:uncharacterized protein YndB with AHSA1/START domain
MTAVAAEQEIQVLHVAKDVQIAAPIGVVFETLLETEPRSGLNLKIEAWPGGRWYRDLGNNTGHLWGHVQVIKPPTLLEICGPMFMSYPVASHIQYRLSEEDGGTRLSLVHQAIGLISPEHQEGVQKGWAEVLQNVRAGAEAKRKK